MNTRLGDRPQYRLAARRAQGEHVLVGQGMADPAWIGLEAPTTHDPITKPFPGYCLTPFALTAEIVAPCGESTGLEVTPPKSTAILAAGSPQTPAARC